MSYFEKFRAFAEFDPAGDPERQKLLNAAAVYAQQYAGGGQAYGLTLLGSSGIGKTHLAHKLYEWAKKYHRNAYPFSTGWPRVAFLAAKDACDRFLSGEYGLPDLMKQEDFLVVDDIGTERDPKGSFRNEMQAIMDRRLGGWTVITSNFDYSQLCEYDARLASRTIRDGGIVVHSRATDWSIKQLKEARQ